MWGNILCHIVYLIILLLYVWLSFASNVMSLFSFNYMYFSFERAIFCRCDFHEYASALYICSFHVKESSFISEYKRHVKVYICRSTNCLSLHLFHYSLSMFFLGVSFHWVHLVTMHFPKYILFPKCNDPMCLHLE